MAMKAIETLYNGYRFRSRLEARWAVFFDTLNISYRYEVDGFDLNGTWYLPDFWLSSLECWIEIKGQEPTDEEIEKADLLAIFTQKPVYIFHGDVWAPEPLQAEKYPLSGEKTSALRCGGFRVVNKDKFQDYEEGDSWLPLEDVPPHIVALFYALDKKNILLSCAWDNNLYAFAPIKELTPKLFSQLRQYQSELLPLLRPFEWDRIGIEEGNLAGFHWCECPKCHSLGIAHVGHSAYLPCQCVYKSLEQEGRLSSLYAREYYAYQTPRLMKAYTAARQARFEHGEKP